MRYRQEDPESGDHLFGRGSFLTNSSAAVAQAIKTRLLLSAGEWFLDSDEGTAYNEVLGYGTQDSRDFEIRDRIVGTPGVLELLAYTSSVTPARKFLVAAQVTTIYGTAAVRLEF